VKSVRRIAVNLNGISIGYMMAIFNAALACAGAYGAHLNDAQIAATATLFNLLFALAIHLAHRIGEAQAGGHVQQVAQQKMDKAAAHENGD
jgi:hypothetical protein